MTEPSNFPHEHDTHCWWDLNQARWVCTPPTSASTAAFDPGALVSEPHARPPETATAGTNLSSANEAHAPL
jgi:hypothetical protein